MNEVFQHFRKDEQPFIEQASGWGTEVEDRYAPKLTGFLDPRQRHIVRAVAGTGDLVITESGGLPEAERKRMMIAPSYFEVQPEDYEISVMEIRYPSKFIEIGHRDVLGSLTGLGIDRARFGDIRTGDGVIQFAADRSLADYLAANLQAVGKAKVRVSEVDTAESLLPLTERYEEASITVSSLRLDTVLAGALNLSRQKAATLIQSGRVKVNHAVRESVSFELSDSDLLSVRGHGRIRIEEIGGRTKKERIRLIIGMLK
ncbi:photosystem II S4 domain protein [Bhargavaea cecembensis DSE10]|uniref:Photosystem II S4 domain protein n=1 Tax=Bhargavaea cecembensis DSE10 TaxID=1235279 RepID=M7PAS6_9BACL|nr:YlmH/Sll1252 family protein [Bhargavaea cecembensis]EMR07589.1 photosystem II S4 domain protein [Bhargavaea cecembensis DSE10]